VFKMVSLVFCTDDDEFDCCFGEEVLSKIGTGELGSLEDGSKLVVDIAAR